MAVVGSVILAIGPNHNWIDDWAALGAFSFDHWAILSALGLHQYVIADLFKVRILGEFLQVSLLDFFLESSCLFSLLVIDLNRQALGWRSAIIHCKLESERLDVKPKAPGKTVHTVVDLIVLVIKIIDHLGLFLSISLVLHLLQAIREPGL